MNNRISGGECNIGFHIGYRIKLHIMLCLVLIRVILLQGPRKKLLLALLTRSKRPVATNIR